MKLRCLFRHKPGAKVYRYRSHPKEIAQSRITRPPAEMLETGFECDRCGAVVEKNHATKGA